VSSALLEAARDHEQRAIDMVNIWSHSGIAQKPSAPGPGFYVQGGSRRLMQHISRGNPAKVFYTDFSACNAYEGGEAAAAALQCPAIFVLGKKDMMTPMKAAGSLISKLPAAEVVQIDACGHALMAEQPDQVLDTLFRFTCASAK